MNSKVKPEAREKEVIFNIGMNLYRKVEMFWFQIKNILVSYYKLKINLFYISNYKKFRSINQINEKKILIIRLPQIKIKASQMYSFSNKLLAICFDYNKLRKIGLDFTGQQKSTF